MADDDAGPVYISRRRVDVAAISQGGGIGSGPSGLIEGKDLHAAMQEVLRHQLRQVRGEPASVLVSVFERGIGTVPLSPEDRSQAQVWQRTGVGIEQEGIEEFLLGVASSCQAVLVDGLTKLLKAVKLFHGIGWLACHNQLLSWGGLAQGNDRLFFYLLCLKSNLIKRTKNQDATRWA